jgi:Amt family ammonium transporter
MKRLAVVFAGSAGGLLLAALAIDPAFAQAAKPPAPELTVNKADDAWMMISAALVLMMTVPGLALFYGGMVRTKNMLSMITQVFAIQCIVCVIYFLWGYSMSFTDGYGVLAPFVGGFSKAFLSGVDIGGKVETFSLGVGIHELVLVCFQMTFAAITTALAIGGYAERAKFSAIVLFAILWPTLVYFPMAHMVWYWPGPSGIATGVSTDTAGFAWQLGALDFAGGTVVHINAGIAGFVGALLLGRRVGYGKEAMPPHSLTLTMVGAALLWVGWFGFNAGSAAAANALAGAAMINTQVATAAAALAWMFCEWLVIKKPSLLGILSGAVAGLVAITPASGFVNPTGALIIGILAGIGCYVAAVHVKKAFGYDDSLDAFGVHGVGGIIGALLTGVFADAAVNELGKDGNLMTQLYGVSVTLIYTAIMSAIILYVVKAVIGLRPTPQEEEEGLDLTQHGESVQ